MNITNNGDSIQLVPQALSDGLQIIVEEPDQMEVDMCNIVLSLEQVKQLHRFLGEYLSNGETRA